MVLPDAWAVWTAFHEAGHATVALALGVKVHRVTIVPDGQRSGHCNTADETFPSARGMLCYQLAGMCAVKRAWPDHWQLAMGTGMGTDHSDLAHAREHVLRCWAVEDAVPVLNAGLDATERIVEEFWPEILRLAERLLAEGTIVCPELPGAPEAA